MANLGSTLSKNGREQIMKIARLETLSALEWCREGESNPQDPKVGGF